MTESSPKTVLDSLNLGLHRVLEDDQRVLLLGEDILDPYGGAFKVSRGLSSAFPDRVITTPISEAGMTGMAGGMALRGLRPVVEIMFGDFTTLIMDQVVNHLAKFSGMYGGGVNVPVVIRTPMGGRRGYGPTHSQTLEKHFLGVPGLWVVAPFHLRLERQPMGLLGAMLYDSISLLYQPILFVEHKTQYLLPLLSPADLLDFDLALRYPARTTSLPCFTLSIKGAPAADVTLTAYGYMAHLAMRAAHRLAYDHEIFCELVVPTCLSPFRLSPLFASVQRTGRLLTVEEGTLSLGWGAEVLARTAESLGSSLKFSGRIAAQEKVIPAAIDLESQMLPDEDAVVSRVLELMS